MRSMKYLLIMLLLILLGGGLLVYYNKFMNNNEEEKVLEKEYTFNNEYGEFNIVADKALECRGIEGTFNNVFYIKDGNLYLYSEDSINELYAMNIDDIYYDEEQGNVIVVDINSDTLIIKESSYLKYLNDEVVDDNNDGFVFDTAYGNVTIKADKALRCTGTAGSSNTIFYMRDNNIYKYVHEGEDELYATKVIDMLYANKSDEVITIVLDEGSNIVKNYSYLKYVSVALNQFVFDTENGQVIINAHKALACRGTEEASNNIFYMVDGNLYLYSSNKVNILYAKNIGNIYYKDEQSNVINVTTNKDTVIVKESSYLNYENISNNKKYEEYTFNTAYGVVTINANKALSCQGWAGASNIIFFIRDNDLYKLKYEGAHELYAKNVDDIYFEKVQTDVMTVLINDSTVILKEESYLKYLNNDNNADVSDNGDLEEFKFSTAYGDVTIKANKALTCNGWAGASNTIFYLKDDNLYKYIHDGKDVLYATGVRDMLYTNKTDEKITIVLDEGSKVIKREEYLLYVTTAISQYVFNTESGQIVINAHKALACRGTAGASNKIFYMIDGNLYLYRDNNKNELYAKNIGNIDYESAQAEVITVTTTKDTVIVKESTYLNYK